MREAEIYACHPLPLATRRHFTDKISSKINRTILQAEKTRKPLHTDNQCFLHEFCNCERRERSALSKFWRKTKKIKRSVTTKTPQKRTPQKEETGEPVTPPHIKNQAEKTTVRNFLKTSWNKKRQKNLINRSITTGRIRLQIRSGVSSLHKTSVRRQSSFPPTKKSLLSSSSSSSVRLGRKRWRAHK